MPCFTRYHTRLLLEEMLMAERLIAN